MRNKKHKQWTRTGAFLSFRFRSSVMRIVVITRIVPWLNLCILIIWLSMKKAQENYIVEFNFTPLFFKMYMKKHHARMFKEKDGNCVDLSFVFKISSGQNS